MPTLTPRYYETRGRAAEIARSFGTPAGAEHLFLGLLHADSAWLLHSVASLVDLGAAEDAVRQLLSGPDYTPPPQPRFPARADFVPIWGEEVAVALDDDYIGLEHALLAMIRARDCVPARALASLADLDALEAAVLAAKNASPERPVDSVFLPEGQALDAPLHQAIFDTLPDQTTYGFNVSADGRTWLHIFGPAPGTDPALTRRVLNAALASLDRPPLDD